MSRPPEYDALVAKGILKDATPNRQSIEQFIRTAEQLQQSISVSMPDVSRFVLAYEATFNIVMAVMEFNGARPGDSSSHRVSAIQRVAADFKLDSSKFSALSRLHDTRNRTTYRSPIPPISKADADAMTTILSDFLQAAKKLTGVA